MSGSRPDPDGSGLDAVQELEAARRRLYSRGGASAAEVVEFERMAEAVPAAGSVPEAQDSDSDSDFEAPVEGGAPGGDERRTAPPRRRMLPKVATGAVAVAVLVVLVVASRPPAVTDVALPTLAGTTILGFARSADPSTRADSVTYQPQGYTVYQPRGRTVAVALRCVGTGRVRISAGARFDFRCGDRERTVSRRDAAPSDQPFVIMGRTVGDVVWSARVVLLDPPQTAGTLPSFKDVCDACLSTSGP